MQNIMQKMGIYADVSSLPAWIEIFANARYQLSKIFQLRVATLCSCVYMIWEACNRRA